MSHEPAVPPSVVIRCGIPGNVDQDSNGSIIGEFKGGGINAPWDVTVDGKDNLWVSNFGPLDVTNNCRSGRISKLCGINQSACPPGAKTGDPISPASGYTMPSAGSEVLLANGNPLY